jgi:hypothetical protein
VKTFIGCFLSFFWKQCSRTYCSLGTSLHVQPRTLTTGGICRHNTGNETYQQIRWNHTCNFSWALTSAPWWWFLLEPKLVGADFVLLMCF